MFTHHNENDLRKQSSVFNNVKVGIFPCLIKTKFEKILVLPYNNRNRHFLGGGSRKGVPSKDLFTLSVSANANVDAWKDIIDLSL